MAHHNSNVIWKKAEKTLRYLNLTRETRRVWNIKTNVVPSIRGASANISKSLIKYMNVPVNHIKEKRNSHTGYRAPTSKSTVVTVQNVYHRTQQVPHIATIKHVYTIETVYAPRTQLCIYRIISKNINDAPAVDTTTVYVCQKLNFRGLHNHNHPVPQTRVSSQIRDGSRLLKCVCGCKRRLFSEAGGGPKRLAVHQISRCITHVCYCRLVSDRQRS